MDNKEKDCKVADRFALYMILFIVMSMLATTCNSCRTLRKPAKEGKPKFAMNKPVSLAMQKATDIFALQK